MAGEVDLGVVFDAENSGAQSLGDAEVVKFGWSKVTGDGADLLKGLVEGPCIYESTAVISPTSGHGDYRNSDQRTFKGIPTDMGDKLEIYYIADGPDDVRKAARLNFANGAHFSK
ncbi:hypothetical protein N9195_00525 [bacterium]|nr:hypothetical protein [bacterium]